MDETTKAIRKLLRLGRAAWPNQPQVQLVIREADGADGANGDADSVVLEFRKLDMLQRSLVTSPPRQTLEDSAEALANWVGFSKVRFEFHDSSLGMDDYTTPRPWAAAVMQLGVPNEKGLIYNHGVVARAMAIAQERVEKRALFVVLKSAGQPAGRVDLSKIIGIVTSWQIEEPADDASCGVLHCSGQTIGAADGAVALAAGQYIVRPAGSGVVRPDGTVEDFTISHLVAEPDPALLT